MAPQKDEKLEALIANEKEWRRVLFQKVEKIEKEVQGLIVWSLIFRAGGATLIGLLFAYFENKIGGK